MPSSSEYIGIAEKIVEREKTVEARLNELGRLIELGREKVSRLERERELKGAEISAELARPVVRDADGNVIDGPNEAKIAQLERAQAALEREIDDAKTEVQIYGQEYSDKQKEQREIEEEKQETLFAIMDAAVINVSDAAKAEGVVASAPAYAGAVQGILSATAAAQANYAQAASILGDGSVSGLSGSGGGGGFLGGDSDLMPAKSGTAIDVDEFKLHGAGGISNTPTDKKGMWVTKTGKPGKRGNSIFVLNDDDEYSTKDGKTTITGKEFKKKYGAKLKEKNGVEGVLYKDGEPDFSPLADPVLRIVVTEKEIPSFRSASKDALKGKGTFQIAEEAVAERTGMTVKQVRAYMKEHKLTWHECADCHTIMAVPTEVNAIFSHKGGISIKRERDAMRILLEDNVVSIKSTQDDICGKYRQDPKEIKKIQMKRRRDYILEKKRLKRFDEGKWIKTGKLTEDGKHITLDSLKD